MWDCGTGSGQAARDLARYFEKVIATDASTAQLRSAVPVPNVEYRVATAESSGLQDASVDLTTVAQALHWFDLEAFYAEVRRVTVRGGIIAAWSYGACSVSASIDRIVSTFQEKTVGPYWDPGRRWVDEGYRTIPFPFAEIEAPSFQLRKEWTLSQFGGYLSSWSSVAKFVVERGQDPVAPVLEQLEKHWGPPDRARTITWPLAVRVGRIG